MSLPATLTALVLLATLHTLIPLSRCSDPPIDLAVDASLILTGGESSADCEYPFMCCGCSRYAGARRGRCLLPHHDQCNWEMGCLTDDDSCGCAWSKCQPYHSLPCHNARGSYACKSYDVSEHMQRCGY